jgi:hypothetical protein
VPTSGMKNICLVNGSLRGKKASSLEFLKDVESRLPDAEYAKKTVSVKARVEGSYPLETLRELATADTLILVFPLFTYAIPGALMRLLEDYCSYVESGNDYNREAKVYAVVNCGFPRPVIFGECVRTLRNVCRRLSLDWRFAVCISSGPVVVMTRRVPFLDLKLKRAFAAIASDLRSDDPAPKDDYLIRPVIPAPICLMIKRQYEKKMDALGGAA